MQKSLILEEALILKANVFVTPGGQWDGIKVKRKKKIWILSRKRDVGCIRKFGLMYIYSCYYV